MTKKFVILLVAVGIIIAAIVVYILFLMPTEQVYDGVLIDNGVKQTVQYMQAV
ncbi:MAG: hypothetical protein Q4G58_11905 [bacterium]|nr:hypothetical protein [bacterium]